MSPSSRPRSRSGTQITLDTFSCITLFAAENSSSRIASETITGFRERTTFEMIESESCAIASAMFSRFRLRATLMSRSSPSSEDQESFVGIRDLDDGIHQRVEQLREIAVVHQAIRELEQLRVRVDIGDRVRRFFFDDGRVVHHREAKLAAADHEAVFVRQLVLAALLAVDDDLLLLREHLQRVGLAVEVHRGVRVGDERIGQHDVVLATRADRRDLLVQAVDRGRVTGCGEA